MSAPIEKVDVDKLIAYLSRSAKVQCSNCRLFGLGRKPCEKCDRMLCEQCRMPMFDKSVRHQCEAIVVRAAEAKP